MKAASRIRTVDNAETPTLVFVRTNSRRRFLICRLIQTANTYTKTVCLLCRLHCGEGFSSMLGQIKERVICCSVGPLDACISRDGTAGKENIPDTLVCSVPFTVWRSL